MDEKMSKMIYHYGSKGSIHSTAIHLYETRPTEEKPYYLTKDDIALLKKKRAVKTLEEWIAEFKGIKQFYNIRLPVNVWNVAIFQQLSFTLVE